MAYFPIYCLDFPALGSCHSGLQNVIRNGYPETNLKLSYIYHQSRHGLLSFSASI